MAPRTFWLILIRILGIYIIIESLNAVSQFLSTIFYVTTRQMPMGSLTFLSALILVLALYGLFFWLFIYRTDVVIDKLALDKGFLEDKIDLNIYGPTAIRIAAVIIGSLVLIDALPLFIRAIFVYAQRSETAGRFKDNPEAGWIIYYLVKLFVGLLLVTNSAAVAKLANPRKNE